MGILNNLSSYLTKGADGKVGGIQSPGKKNTRKRKETVASWKQKANTGGREAGHGPSSPSGPILFPMALIFFRINIKDHVRHKGKLASIIQLISDTLVQGGLLQGSS